MSGIEIASLNKSWATFNAVQDVSFTVEAGTLTVLLGPSGCGKSTTLRLIAGLEGATSGAIRIGGRDVTNEPPARRDLAMVFQSYALFPHLSVAENIVFGLKVRKVPAAERARRLQRAVDILGLSHLLDRKPSQLSGGQQQRVALGRAIVAEAPVCLMDEPLSNLDAQLRHEMRKEIRSIQKSLGMTMVYVTHDQIEAMTLADRIIVLDAGRIMQAGSPRELYERPANTFVARFIGSPRMNLLPAAAFPDAPAGSALIGLRPEDVTIGGEGPLSGQIEALEYHGADLSAFVDCGAAGRITLRAPGLMGLREGDRVTLAFDPARAHYFNISGDRI